MVSQPFKPTFSSMVTLKKLMKKPHLMKMVLLTFAAIFPGQAASRPMLALSLPA
mgnify:CR=1 FL=1